MKRFKNSVAALAILAGAAVAMPASAAVTLNLVASYAKSNGAFGLAYDGTNIWYSNAYHSC